MLEQLESLCLLSGDPPLTGSVGATAGGTAGAFNTSLLSGATFTDADPSNHTGDLTTVLINWGEGGAASPGTVSYNGGVYTVGGSHTYANAGSYPIIITVTDLGGQTATITGTVAAATAIPPPVVVSQDRNLSGKKHQIAQILITFSGPINAIEADEIGIYQLVSQGKKGSFTGKGAKPIRPRSAVYNGATVRVTPTPTKPFALTKPVHLQVMCAPPLGLQDTFGQFVDGGSNAIASLSRGGVSRNAPTMSRVDLQRAMEPTVVDAEIEREGTLGSRLARREQASIRANRALIHRTARSFLHH